LVLIATHRRSGWCSGGGHRRCSGQHCPWSHMRLNALTITSASHHLVRSSARPIIGRVNRLVSGGQISGTKRKKADRSPPSFRGVNPC